jgi:hypothetical protein
VQVNDRQHPRSIAIGAKLVIAFFIAALANVSIWVTLVRCQSLSSKMYLVLWWFMMRAPYVICALPGIHALVRKRWLESAVMLIGGVILGAVAYVGALWIAWLVPIPLPRP